MDCLKEESEGGKGKLKKWSVSDSLYKRNMNELSEGRTINCWSKNEREREGRGAKKYCAQ